jgi:hypothetical protein
MTNDVTKAVNHIKAKSRHRDPEGEQEGQRQPQGRARGRHHLVTR